MRQNEVDDTKVEKQDFLGHRKRVKNKYKRLDLRMLDDCELLELLLFYAIPRVDTKKIAKSLIKRFGSITGVIAADAEAMQYEKNLGDNAFLMFKVLSDIIARIYLPVEKNVHIVNNWASVVHYCQFIMGFSQHEHFMILYLSKKNVVIFYDTIHGTIDNVAIYPAEIAKKAIVHNAASVVIAHNHPSGDVTPSEADILITKQVKDILKAVGISLYDHIIVSSNSYLSFKMHGII